MYIVHRVLYTVTSAQQKFQKHDTMIRPSNLAVLIWSNQKVTACYIVKTTKYVRTGRKKLFGSFVQSIPPISWIRSMVRDRHGKRYSVSRKKAHHISNYTSAFYLCIYSVFFINFIRLYKKRIREKINIKLTNKSNPVAWCWFIFAWNCAKKKKNKKKKKSRRRLLPLQRE